MFNVNKQKKTKETKNTKSKFNWLQFSSAEKKDELLSSLMADNKFIQEDLKIRAMVEDMLQKEFSSEIKNIKDYDFLVDSVVDRLKKKQLGKISEQDNTK